MEQAWQTIGAFWNDCRERSRDQSQNQSIDLLLRLLLSSDGTVIRYLNSLFLSPTGLEIVNQSEIVMDDESSALLQIPSGKKAIERKVWLCNQCSTYLNGRLLYAVSIFPLSKIQTKFYQEMQLGKKPLGQIIDEHALSTRRDRLEIASLPFPDVAQGFGLPEDHLFWARRYRLIISGQLSASIREVLSPQLFSLSS